MFGESVFLFSVFSSLFLFFENGANILKNARNIWNDMRVKNVKFKKILKMLLLLQKLALSKLDTAENEPQRDPEK